MATPGVGIPTVVGSDNDQPVFISRFRSGLNRVPDHFNPLIHELNSTGLQRAVTDAVPNVIRVLQINPRKVGTLGLDIVCGPTILLL